MEAAKKSVYPVFLNENSNKKESIESFKSYNTYLLNVLDESIENDTLYKQNPTFLTSRAYTYLKNLRIRQRNLIKSRGPIIKDLFRTAETILNSVYNKGVLSIYSDEQMRDSIAVRRGNFDTIEPINKFLYLDKAKQDIQNQISKVGFSNELDSVLNEYTVHFLLPTIIYSEKLTNEEIDQAQSNVSRYSGIVNENERIVAKHDRITKETKLKIESYKEAKGELISTGDMILQAVGKFIHIGLIISLLVTYLFLFRKKIFYNNRKLLVFVITILFVSFITFLINQIQV
ncbi:MAG: hydrolase, partial [Ignavibacteriaceae bacterium]